MTAEAKELLGLIINVGQLAVPPLVLFQLLLLRSSLASREQRLRREVGYFAAAVAIWCLMAVIGITNPYRPLPTDVEAYGYWTKLGTLLANSDAIDEAIRPVANSPVAAVIWSGALGSCLSALNSYWFLRGAAAMVHPGSSAGLRQWSKQAVRWSPGAPVVVSAAVVAMYWAPLFATDVPLSQFERVGPWTVEGAIAWYSLPDLVFSMLAATFLCLVGMAAWSQERSAPSVAVAILAVLLVGLNLLALANSTSFLPTRYDFRNLLNVGFLVVGAGFLAALVAWESGRIGRSLATVTERVRDLFGDAQKYRLLSDEETMPLVEFLQARLGPQRDVLMAFEEGEFSFAEADTRGQAERRRDAIVESLHSGRHAVVASYATPPATGPGWIVLLDGREVGRGADPSEALADADAAGAVGDLTVVELSGSA